MENRMADKTMTTCASMLVALFQKRRQQQEKKLQAPRGCSCMCHTYENKNKNLSELNEMNDNKFFNCKCSHECQNEIVKCKKCASKNRKDKKKKPKKIVKFQIQHTGSMSSLASPNKHPLCSCEKLKNTLSLCKILNGKTNNECMLTSSTHNGACQVHWKSQSDLSGNGTFGSSAVGRAELLSRLNDQTDKKAKATTNQESRPRKPPTSTDDQRPKSFYEWTIPFENIEVGEFEAMSPNGPVYRGRWHGDVMIYTRSHGTESEIEYFHNEVSLLGLIRHDNVVLFMGACIEPPNLAVITSVRKGHTLYTHLHARQTSFHFGSKFSIAKQIAQGMGYLHAKGITLGKLCSRNIFLESKVKIAITDYTLGADPCVKTGYGCIPKGHLTYLSPELMRSLQKVGLYLSCTERASTKADVFAYGTLLFEIFLGRYPFNGSHPEIIIWKTSNGHTQTLDGTDFPLIFKGLIQSCWARNTDKRPEFHEILTSMRKLNIPRSLQKKLSLSDSGAINKPQNMHHAAFNRLNASPTQTVRWNK